MNKNQDGFSIIEVLLLVVVIGLISTLIWTVLNRQSAVKNTNTSPPAATEKKESNIVDPYKDWKVGSFKSTKLSYKLPPNWQDTSKNVPIAGGQYKDEAVQITAADGLVLSMSANNMPHGYEGDPNNVVLEFKNIDNSHQWIIADNANGKVSRIYVGSGVKEVGDKILAAANVPQDGLSVIINAEYNSELGSLAEFNQKQSVKEAKLVFESLKFN